jgi:predicted glycogen debranching enzyme
MLSFNKQICTDFEAATSREWLETNGIGGFASGTISGANTRRYHGLLTAATRPPLGRVTVLSKFEEVLEIGGRQIELSTNQFAGGVAPNGYLFLAGFRLDPFPIWTYAIEDLEIEKRLFMIHGSNATVCRWSISKGSADQAKLMVKPLLSFVDYHSLQHQSPEITFSYRMTEKTVSVTANGQMPSLHIHHNGADIEDTGHWYNAFAYSIEEERGFDFTEDLYQPFAMKFDLSNGPATLMASTDDTAEMDYASAAKLLSTMPERKASLRNSSFSQPTSLSLPVARARR